ncbi:hypothetical protein [Halorhabdus rudnickae]|uniref:hypothetical protein n=1 Tax=Halorhabdus rudnickae TaxID=1775544 RepID=UPI0014382916|nr:hypothetical protein [Halorhabdus rudnickae]
MIESSLPTAKSVIYPLLLPSIADFVDGILGALFDFIFGLFEQIVVEVIQPIGEELGDFWLALILHTPKPLRHGDPALMRQPTNTPWREGWEIYWNFVELALVLGIVLYLTANFVAAIPWVSSKVRESMRGGFIKTMVALALGWPLMTSALFLINAVNNLFAPPSDRFGFLVSWMVSSGAVAGLAGPQAIFGGILASIDLTLVAILGALFILRILFMVFGVVFAPMFIMAWALGVPIVKDIGKSIISMWVKIGLAPSIIAGMYWMACLILTSPDGSGGYDYTGFTFMSSIGMLFGLILMFVIPLAGFIAFYFVLQASLGTTASRGINTVQRKAKKRRLGGGGETGKGAMPNVVQEKAGKYKQWRDQKVSAAKESVSSGAQGAANAARSAGMAGAAKAQGAYWDATGAGGRTRAGSPAVAGAAGAGAAAGGSISNYRGPINDQEQKAAAALNEDRSQTASAGNPFDEIVSSSGDSTGSAGAAAGAAAGGTAGRLRQGTSADEVLLRDDEYSVENGETPDSVADAATRSSVGEESGAADAGSGGSNDSFDLGGSTGHDNDTNTASDGVSSSDTSQSNDAPQGGIDLGDTDNQSSSTSSPSDDSNLGPDADASNDGAGGDSATSGGGDDVSDNVVDDSTETSVEDILDDDSDSNQ